MPTSLSYLEANIQAVYEEYNEVYSDYLSLNENGNIAEQDIILLGELASDLKDYKETIVDNQKKERSKEEIRVSIDSRKIILEKVIKELEENKDESEIIIQDQSVSTVQFLKKFTQSLYVVHEYMPPATFISTSGDTQEGESKQTTAAVEHPLFTPSVPASEDIQKAEARKAAAVERAPSASSVVELTASATPIVEKTTAVEVTPKSRGGVNLNNIELLHNRYSELYAADLSLDDRLTSQQATDLADLALALNALKKAKENKYERGWIEVNGRRYVGEYLLKRGTVVYRTQADLEKFIAEKQDSLEEVLDILKKDNDPNVQALEQFIDDLYSAPVAQLAASTKLDNSNQADLSAPSEPAMRRSQPPLTNSSSLNQFLSNPSAANSRSRIFLSPNRQAVKRTVNQELLIDSILDNGTGVAGACDNFGNSVKVDFDSYTWRLIVSGIVTAFMQDIINNRQINSQEKGNSPKAIADQRADELSMRHNSVAILHATLMMDSILSAHKTFNPQMAYLIATGIVTGVAIMVVENKYYQNIMASQQEFVPKSRGPFDTPSPFETPTLRIGTVSSN